MPGTNASWFKSTTELITLPSLVVIILDMIMYSTEQHEIGLMSFICFASGFLGIRVTSYCSVQSLFDEEILHCLNYFLPNHTPRCFEEFCRIPSTPGALWSPVWFKAFLICSTCTGFTNFLLSSSVNCSPLLIALMLIPLFSHCVFQLKPYRASVFPSQCPQTQLTLSLFHLEVLLPHWFYFCPLLWHGNKSFFIS